MVDGEEAEGLGTDDVIKLGGGGLFFIAGLLTWWELDTGLSERSTAFDYLFTGVVPYVIFVAIAIITLLDRTGSLRLPSLVLEPLLQLLAAGVATLLVAWRFVFSDWDSDSVTRGPGLYLAAVAGLVVLAGCIMTVRDLDLDEGEAARVAADDSTPTRAPRPPLP